MGGAAEVIDWFPFQSFVKERARAGRSGVYIKNEILIDPRRKRVARHVVPLAVPLARSRAAASAAAIALITEDARPWRDISWLFSEAQTAQSQAFLWGRGSMISRWRASPPVDRAAAYRALPALYQAIVGRPPNPPVSRAGTAGALALRCGMAGILSRRRSSSFALSAIG